jgi:isocitrate dehydrogenase
MFEAIHGSAPRAPTEPGQPFRVAARGHPDAGAHRPADVAERVHNAWLRRSRRVHTYDIFKPEVSKQKVGTKEFAQAVVARLGQRPEKLKPVTYNKADRQDDKPYVYHRPTPRRELVGQDIFVFHIPGNSNEVAAMLEPAAQAHGLELVMISNRGVKVWPDPLPETNYVDVWRCRLQKPDRAPVTLRQMLELQQHLAGAGVDIVKMEGLFTFDGEIGFSLGQGQ